MAPVKKPATYEDVLAAPEHVVAEIVAGELFTTPRPSPRHGYAASALGAVLASSYGWAATDPGGWWLLQKTEVHIGGDVLVPDLLGFRFARMPELPDQGWFSIPPDWVCEVLSPGTGSLDRARKLPAHARGGVAWAWLVDPAERTLEVLRRDEDLWVVVAAHGADDRLCAEPFPAVEFQLSVLWGDREQRV